MKIGEYYRTKNGLIRQVKTMNTPETRKQKHLGYTKRNIPLVNGRHTLDDIESHSKNIIDLIQVGDYVNGEKINTIRNYNGEKHVGVENGEGMLEEIFANKDIKSITTKEQFASLELIINTKIFKE